MSSQVPAIKVPGAEKPLRVPSWMMRAVENRPGSGARRPMQVAWFYRFLETGNAEQSAIDVGYSPKGVSSMAWKLKIEFANVLPEAMKFIRSWLEADALNLLGHVVAQGLDPKNKKDPKMLTASAKAAGEILDRGGMPKGMASHGLDPSPDDRGSINGQDSFKLLDQLAKGAGIEAVRQMEFVMNYRMYREYVEQKWLLKEIETP